MMLVRKSFQILYVLAKLQKQDYATSYKILREMKKRGWEMQENYVYKVINTLAREGLITKKKNGREQILKIKNRELMEGIIKLGDLLFSLSSEVASDLDPASPNVSHVRPDKQ